jgi:DNA invertase Pin-like site-specific DNA recombinase
MGAHWSACISDGIGTMPSAIPYYHVSTARQGKSGLGIEAQKAAVARFAEAEGIAVTGEHTEVETGKGADALERRPELAAALAETRKSTCSVIVAKLDRLSRDAHFISGLMSHGCRSSSPGLARTPTRTSMPHLQRRNGQ